MPEAAIVDFLIKRFSEEELRRLVRYHYQELTPDLPGSPSSLKAVADGWVQLLARNGRLDADFFALLRAERERFSDDIGVLEHLARADAPASSPARETVAKPTPVAATAAAIRSQTPFFICYAQHDRRLVTGLLDRLSPHLASSRRYAFERWQDSDVLVGEEWDAEILAAVERHRICLLLVSPTFLTRPYILEKELPRLLRPGKILLPVLVKPIDLDRQDARGIETLKIFTLLVADRRQAYSECATPQKKDRFALELFRAIEERLDRDHIV